MRIGCKTAYFTQINTKRACHGSCYCGKELTELMEISYRWQGRMVFAKGDAWYLNPTPIAVQCRLATAMPSSIFICLLRNKWGKFSCQSQMSRCSALSWPCPHKFIQQSSLARIFLGVGSKNIKQPRIPLIHALTLTSKIT